ncbi:MAG: hypothetical protein GF388_08825 [Candidatus Aegiribacteria sp.]|nr:hypothetical protein [Candidatus Aegiribacteria sp.]MBD3295180.1 hypothetical protein [Candidatus Fermentibacteria bacterium]
MSLRSLVIVFTSALLVLSPTGCGGGSSQNGDTGMAVSAADPGLQKFAVSIQGDDVGYMQLEIRDHGEDSLLILQSIDWNMILMGNRRDIQMTLEAVAARDYDLGRMEMRMTDGSAEISVNAVRRDSLLVTEIGTAGRMIENSTVIGGDYLPVLADLACASMEWTEGQNREFRSFDPASGMIISSSAVCEGFEAVSLLGDTVEAARLKLSQMGTTNTVWVYDGQIVREYEGGLGMEMTRVPPQQGGEITATRDLYEVFAVTSTPVEDPRSVRSRTFILEGEIDWSTFQLNVPPVQTARGCTVHVDNSTPDNSVPYPVQSVPDSLLQFTEARSMIQSRDSLIAAKADSITVGCATAWEAARRICGFVDTAVENSPTVSLPSAVEVLENLRGDCNEHTILTVALARAAGIPARVCAGIVYLDGAFGYHAWPMVWTGRWVEMDPTFGQYVADGTHIILAVGDLESQYVINSAIGRLSVREVVSN